LYCLTALLFCYTYLLNIPMFSKNILEHEFSPWG
jgi:hypothetical protein